MGAFLAAAPIISQAQLSGVGSTITVGTVFTYNGQEFTIVTPPDPNYQTEPTSERTLETNAFIALRNAGISFTLNGTVYSIDEAIANGLLAVSKTPFDLGLGVVLGAGAIAAAKRARSRRRQQQAIA